MRILMITLALMISFCATAARADGQPKEVKPVNATVITSNDHDRRKLTSNNEFAVSMTPAISVQEHQFCRIIENFRVENQVAIASGNEIKVNQSYRNLAQSLNSLLPHGRYKGWLMRAISVSQDPHGRANIILEMPCNVKTGSVLCENSPNIFAGTVREGSRIYTEMAKMTVGDYVVVNGIFNFVDPAVFDRHRSVASFKFFKTAPHCVSSKIPVSSNMMGMHLTGLSVIK